MRQFRGRNLLEATAPNWHDMKETNKCQVDFNHTQVHFLRTNTGLISTAQVCSTHMVRLMIALHKCNHLPDVRVWGKKNCCLWRKQSFFVDFMNVLLHVRCSSHHQSRRCHCAQKRKQSMPVSKVCSMLRLATLRGGKECVTLHVPSWFASSQFVFFFLPTQSCKQQQNNEHHQVPTITTTMDDTTFESLQNTLSHHNEWEGHGMNISVNEFPELEELLEIAWATCIDHGNKAITCHDQMQNVLMRCVNSCRGMVGFCHLDILTFQRSDIWMCLFFFIQLFQQHSGTSTIRHFNICPSKDKRLQLAQSPERKGHARNRATRGADDRRGKQQHEKTKH
jgi:hypothetical protein